MISEVRGFLKSFLFLRKLFAYYLFPSGFFDLYLEKYKLSQNWMSRIQKVYSCPDNDLIIRHPKAGLVTCGKQFMHNGLKVNIGSYYGPEGTIMLKKNFGVHEPQEERVFQEILKLMPANAVMVELGSFWSFYSLWFHQKVFNPTNYMVEPDSFNLGQGVRNFKLNRFNGVFLQAYISNYFRDGLIPTFTVDYLLEKFLINRVNILHADIQGAELDMLSGSVKSFNLGLVDFVFVSTHSNDLHYNCLAFLKNYNFSIIAEADLNNSFSEDGLIVASARHISPKFRIEISKITD
jgi:hypothetical protein